MCSLESFEDVWPLDDAQRIIIIKRGTLIVREMKILVLSEERGKEKEDGDESGTTDGRKDEGTKPNHPSETTEGAEIKHEPPGDGTTDRLIPITNHAEKGESEPLDANIHLDTVIDEFERYRGATGSNPDRLNLIDLLYNEGCISLLHKHHIEQQPTQQQQNLEMLQLIQNGSIKTFNVGLEYFRGTNQDHVFDLLKRKYLSEGNLCVTRLFIFIFNWSV